MEYTFKVDGRELDARELKKTLNFLLRLSKASLRTKLIYRAESIQNLKDKLNISTEDFYSELNYRLFNLGDKARIYQQQYYDNLNGRRHFAIEDVNINVFEYLFEKFNRIFRTTNNKELLRFMSKNGGFVEYFLQNGNREKLFNTIASCTESEKLNIRDYYLALLHKVGKVGFHGNSFFVSTSTSHKAAKKFQNNKSIMLVGWQNIPSFPAIKKLLISNRLPFASYPIYPLQREISLKGGFLPHYLLGYIITETSEFILNPIFLTTSIPIEKIITYGLPLNQQHFFQILNQTNYTGYFTIDDNENYSDDLT